VSEQHIDSIMHGATIKFTPLFLTIDTGIAATREPNEATITYC